MAEEFGPKSLLLLPRPYYCPSTFIYWDAVYTFRGPLLWLAEFRSVRFLSRGAKMAFLSRSRLIDLISAMQMFAASVGVRATWTNFRAA